MKRITFLLLFLIVGLAVQAQVISTPTADSARVGKADGTSGIALFGKIYFKNVTPNSVLKTNANGKVIPVTLGISDISGLQTALDTKVDKITGKGLSTEDYTSAEKTKLAGIASGATANQTDAYLLSRTNHTGTQAISTIVNLQTSLDAKLASSLKGAAGGLAELDGSGKVPLSQINDALIGAVNYQGTYNATTNTPTLPSASGNKGKYYIISTAGTVSSISYGVGDWIISDGTSWGKVDNNNLVSSVFGRVGTITAQASDYSAYYLRLTGGTITGDLTATANVFINAPDYTSGTRRFVSWNTSTGLLENNSAAQVAAFISGQNINTTGTAAIATTWGGSTANFSVNQAPANSAGVASYNITSNQWEYISKANLQTALGISGGPFIPLSWGSSNRVTGDAYFANNRFLYTRNAANSADILVIGLDNANKVRIDPTGVGTEFGGRLGVGNSAANARLEVTQSTGEVFRADAAGGAYRIVAHQTGTNLGGSVDISGALTGTSANFSEQGRFKGWYTSGSGEATEIGTSSGVAYVVGYNRTAVDYIPLGIEGKGITVYSSAGITLQAGNSQIAVTGNIRPSVTNGYELGASSLRWNYIFGNSGDFSGALNVGGAGTFGGNVTGANLSGTNTGDQTWSTLSGKPTFAAIATSGAYADIAGRPTKLSDLTNDLIYSWALASTKPSYTWSEILSKPTFADVAFSGLYSDLGGTPSLSGFELLSNKATSLSSPDNTKYPTTLAVSNAITAAGANPTYSLANGNQFSTKGIYTYSGSGAIQTYLGAVSDEPGTTVYIVNRGSGNVLLDTYNGAGFIWNAGSLSNTMIIAPGEEIHLINDGTYFIVVD